MSWADDTIHCPVWKNGAALPRKRKNKLNPKIDENLDDVAKPKPYHKRMDGSTKQIHRHEDEHKQVREDRLVEPSQSKNGGDGRPPYSPHGTLERLARILVDIARNPHVDDEPERPNNTLQ